MLKAILSERDTTCSKAQGIMKAKICTSHAGSLCALHSSSKPLIARRSDSQRYTSARPGQPALELDAGSAGSHGLLQSQDPRGMLAHPPLWQYLTCICFAVQVFILDSLAWYKPRDSKDAESIVERVTPRLQHANCAVVLSAVKVTSSAVLGALDSMKCRQESCMCFLTLHIAFLLSLMAVQQAQLPCAAQL